MPDAMPAGYRTCPACITYATARKSALIPAMAARRSETGESASEIRDRYMTGVHARHLSGLPILPEQVAS